MLRSSSSLLLLLGATAVSGCAFDENLPQVDVTGVIIIPAEATIRPHPVTGEPMEPDSRFIGPVYLGAYPDIRDDLFEYPHPEMGPVISTGLPGDTYPYGGGSVGRFDFACFSSTICRVVTGRYSDWDSMVDFFKNSVGQPITDEFGNSVESSAYYRSYCNDLFEYTADFEYDFIAGEDLHFEMNSDGDWEAEFSLWQVTYQQDMKIWGWMDAPNERFSFSTCDPSRGQNNTEYSNEFEYGASFSNLLNFPSTYVHQGDWVVSEAHTVTDVDADEFRDNEHDIVLRLDLPVEG